MKTTVVLSSKKLPPADLLIAGFFSKEPFPKELSAVEPEFAKLAGHALKKGRFAGNFGEIFSSYQSGFSLAPEIVLMGLGERKNHKELCCRKAAGQIVRLIKERKAAKARVFLPSFSGGKVSLNSAAAAFTEISRLAAYDFNRYKTRADGEKKRAGEKALSLELLVTKGQTEAGARKASERARVLAEATVFTRDLINEPANVMNAPRLAETARKMASQSGLQCRVLGLSELKSLKMGGILAVNQGSVHPPALIILEHGKRHRSKGTLCLVGKGVTFDTGGISIKPSKGMEKMKYDMSGAAAVLGAMKAIAELRLPVHVVALTPAVENNVANDPQRPGDIIRMFSGKTVEVLNTDAEGRLILADAIAYSARFKPKAIIDIATLTGMCAYTFADQAIGLMGNDEKLLARVKEAGLQTGERCWELPTWEEYGSQIKGQQSDLKNIGGAYGGTITAAMFLKEFVPSKTAWAHLDIAGTAWCEAPRYDAPVGATGVGVRLLTEFAARWR